MTHVPVPRPSTEHRRVRFPSAVVVLFLALTALLGGTAPAFAQTASALYAGDRLDIGESLTAGEYHLVMQSDGNLVLYRGSTALWASFTTNRGSYAAMQSDGNLVVYGSSGAVWYTATNGSGASKAALQGDGNFVLYGSSAIWATGTNGGVNRIPESRAMSQAEALINDYPYSWGGGHGSSPGPTYGTCANYSGPSPCQAPSTYGFDCSGFARYAYSLGWGRDVLGAGGTSSQIGQGTRTTSPDPGDLVFFGSSTSQVHHVGVYIGAGKIVNAKETGTRIQISSIASFGDLLEYRTY